MSLLQGVQPSRKELLALHSDIRNTDDLRKPARFQSQLLNSQSMDGQVAGALADMLEVSGDLACDPLTALIDDGWAHQTSRVAHGCDPQDAKL